MELLVNSKNEAKHALIHLGLSAHPADRQLGTRVMPTALKGRGLFGAEYRYRLSMTVFMT